jgi:hypothetical protein
MAQKISDLAAPFQSFFDPHHEGQHGIPAPQQIFSPRGGKYFGRKII